MKTDVKILIPAFRLGNEHSKGEYVEVSSSDLRKAAVGTTWETRNNCGNNIEGERAEVVYQTEKGAAVLFRYWKEIDANNPTAKKLRVLEEDPYLRWCEFA